MHGFTICMIHLLCRVHTFFYFHTSNTLVFSQLYLLGVQYAILKTHRRRMRDPPSMVEFKYASTILSPHCSDDSLSLTLGEFIILKLMQMGLTSPNQIDSIAKAFCYLDRYKRSKLSYDDLINTIDIADPVEDFDWTLKRNKNSSNTISSL
jgi:hypothetical protein